MGLFTNMKIGYSRISTDDQNLHLQKDALTKAGCEKFFDDVISGAKSKRPGLDALIEFARESDTIVVWRLDRLGRSMKDLINLVSTLEDNNVHINLHRYFWDFKKQTANKYSYLV